MIRGCFSRKKEENHRERDKKEIFFWKNTQEFLQKREPNRGKRAKVEFFLCKYLLLAVLCSSLTRFSIWVVLSLVGFSRFLFGSISGLLLLALGGCLLVAGTRGGQRMLVNMLSCSLILSQDQRTK